jgi:hypothetical protein
VRDRDRDDRLRPAGGDDREGVVDEIGQTEIARGSLRVAVGSPVQREYATAAGHGLDERREEGPVRALAGQAQQGQPGCGAVILIGDSHSV